MLVFAIAVLCRCLSATMVVSLILDASKLWKVIWPALISARTTVLWLFASCPLPSAVSVRENFWAEQPSISVEPITESVEEA